jgi:hypothetical protein
MIMGKNILRIMENFGRMLVNGEAFSELLGKKLFSKNQLFS